MKVLLINPLSDVARQSNAYFRSVTPLPPLGLASLAAVLKKHGVDVVIEDQYASRKENAALLGGVADFAPDVVGISCLTTAMSNVKRIAALVRSERPEAAIVLGNIHPTIFAEEVLREGIGDIVVRGEGEESFLEAVLSAGAKGDLGNIKGISYACGGKIRHNPDRENMKDLDSLPFPDWSGLDLRHYRRYPMLGIYDKLVLPVQASRGCPYHCRFCSQDKFYKTPRYRNVVRVVDEIEYLYETFHINCVGFLDAYFPFSKSTGLEFCDELIRRKLNKKIRWFTETRVDMVDLELMKRMKEANLYLIMYGFETGNQAVLDDTGKATTIEQARKAVEYTKKFNIVCMGLFMIGLPGETARSCRETFRFAKELDPDIVKFNIAVPFPGSKFFDETRGIIGDIDKSGARFTSWQDWASSEGEIVYHPKDISREELVALQRKGMFEFYVRPRVMLKHLLKGTFSLKDLFWGGFLLAQNYGKTLLKPCGR